MAFLKIFLIPDFRGLSFKKRCFFLFSPLPKNGYKDFLVFCMSVVDNRVNFLNQMAFLKIFLISDYRVLSVQERCVFSFFSLYSKTALRISLGFFMNVENNWVHRLSHMDFPRKFLIQDYRGVSVLKRCFLNFFGLFSKTALKYFPNFLRDHR